ncbi:hypothetical protein RirG_098100 [Rhizophagus irregularis DAOM 197198w]|uniref:Uncharacterized protein n=1 Tax=Rhizophagus irregularis (strain DAOM 197198w) TaxID=1432141 RepID=A0A015KNR9_RHIIW|nr:hypothetical protein RirG_098100 [Rhizophagus irregularis DAOM 197198w]
MLIVQTTIEKLHLLKSNSSYQRERVSALREVSYSEEYWISKEQLVYFENGLEVTNRKISSFAT